MVASTSEAVAVAGIRAGIQGVDTIDGALDKVRIVTGELEVAKALASVKIFQHVQEELVAQLVLL